MSKLDRKNSALKNERDENHTHHTFPHTHTHISTHPHTHIGNNLGFHFILERGMKEIKKKSFISFLTFVTKKAF